MPGESPAAAGLAPVDWAIVLAYAAATIGLGWFYSRRQTSTQEYFVGSGRLNPFLVGVSLFATLLSTTSYLALPGETIGKGPVYHVSLLLLPVVYWIVSRWLLPVYMRQRVTSAYELLEMKLGLSIRLLGAFLFLALRLTWMSLLVHITAEAMAIMLGVREEYSPAIAVVTGLVAVTYTSLGGLRAVIITDLMQTILLYGGALLVIAVITVDLGGFVWIPTTWKDTWDSQPFFPTNWSTRVTLVGTVVNALIWYVCTAGGDQTSVQRFMATEDARAARRAFGTQMAMSILVGVTLAFVGLALLGYFEAHPELLPKNVSLKENTDKLFPHFIAFRLPVGISGLVVAAFFAAAMSSIDSGVNSITAVVMTDGFDRLKGREGSEEKHLRSARWLALGIGAVAVVGSSLIGLVPGNILAVANRTSNLLTTPIFGLFFYALFVPFATPAGAWAGTICGIVAAVLVAFSGSIFGPVPGTELDPISFQWIAPISIAVNLTIGCLTSLLFEGGRPNGA